MRISDWSSDVCSSDLGNIGLPLTDSGFINISGELNDDDRTVRARRFTSSSWDPPEAYETDPAFRAAVDAAHVDLTKPLERMGKPSERGARLIVYSGIELTDDTPIYAFGNFSTPQGIENKPEKREVRKKGG